MKNIKVILSFVFALVIVLSAGVTAFAAYPDEITSFTVTANPNPDATLRLTYHIDWLVLDSDELGPLEWAEIGLPNSHHYDIVAESSTITSMNDTGSTVKIYFDRPYYEGETVSFDFSLTQDNMYQINKYNDGETVYTFTPAWFDAAETDSLTVIWNMENASSWQPDCSIEGGYLVFEAGHMDAGQKYTMSVSYPNDAYGFSEEHQETDRKSVV